MIPLELFTVYYLFSFNIFSGLAIVFFLNKCYSQIVKGFLQYLRYTLIRSSRKKHESLFSLLGSWLIVVAISIALIQALTIAVIGTSQEWANAVLVYALVITLSIPARFFVSYYWMYAYLSKRVKLKITYITGIRLTPILTLLLFWKVLGPYAIVLGFLMGNILSLVYGYSLIKKHPDFSKIVRSFRFELSSSLLKNLTNSNLTIFWGYSSLFPIYNLINYFLVCSYFPEQQNIYLMIYFTVYLICYPALQIARSLSLDLYLFAKRSRIRLTHFYIKNLIFIALTIILITLCCFYLGYFHFTSMVSLELNKLLPYYGTLILAYLGRTIYLFQESLHTSLKSERAVFNFTLVSITILLALQTISVIVLSLDFKILFLLESLYFISMSSYLLFFIRAEYSYPYRMNLFRRMNNGNLNTSELLKLIHCVKIFKIPHTFSMICLDIRYNKTNVLKGLSKKLRKDNVEFYYLKLFRRYFLCLSFSNNNNAKNMSLNNKEDSSFQNISSKLKDQINSNFLHAIHYYENFPVLEIKHINEIFLKYSAICKVNGTREQKALNSLTSLHHNQTKELYDSKIFYQHLNSSSQDQIKAYILKLFECLDLKAKDITFSKDCKNFKLFFQDNKLVRHYENGLFSLLSVFNNYYIISYHNLPFLAIKFENESNTVKNDSINKDIDKNVITEALILLINLNLFIDHARKFSESRSIYLEEPLLNSLVRCINKEKNKNNDSKHINSLINVYCYTAKKKNSFNFCSNSL